MKRLVTLGVIHNTSNAQKLNDGLLLLAGDTLGVLLLGGSSGSGQTGSAGLLGLELVDSLHQDTLGSVAVTLNLEVELVVNVLVNLLVGAIFLQHTTENAETTHPDNLEGETSIGSTLALTVTGVTTLLDGGIATVLAGARVDSIRLLHDETILVELADTLTAVGQRDLRDLSGVQPEGKRRNVSASVHSKTTNNKLILPNLALSALKHGSGQTLLKTQIYHSAREKLQEPKILRMRIQK